ncbi:MAG: L,D-transpeptidase family protein [Deltaproteobacteria bacterium]|nr:L,D-transpeptidase family protein [Deltaproteobacteria bacterium]
MKCQFAFIVVLILATSLSASAARHTKGRAVQQLTSEFKNSDYVWHPEISPAGPVVIIVSLPAQRMYVYRNGVQIGVSTVSTGTKSHATPTGIFTILQKKGQSRIEHLQRSTDASYAAADVDRHCHARRSPAWLSGITWVCAVAGRFRCKTIFRHGQRY